MKGPSGKEPQQRVNSYETCTFVKSGKHPVNQIQELNGCLLKGLTFILKLVDSLYAYIALIKINI